MSWQPLLFENWASWAQFSTIWYHFQQDQLSVKPCKRWLLLLFRFTILLLLLISNRGQKVWLCKLVKIYWLILGGGTLVPGRGDVGEDISHGWSSSQDGFWWKPARNPSQISGSQMIIKRTHLPYLEWTRQIGISNISPLGRAYIQGVRGYLIGGVPLLYLWNWHGVLQKRWCQLTQIIHFLGLSYCVSKFGQDTIHRNLTHLQPAHGGHLVSNPKSIAIMDGQRGFVVTTTAPRTKRVLVESLIEGATLDALINWNLQSFVWDWVNSSKELGQDLIKHRYISLS